MDCQTTSAKAIMVKEADYLFAVKSNQETLFTALKNSLISTTKRSATNLARDLDKRPKINTIGVAMHYHQQTFAKTRVSRSHPFSQTE